MGRVSIWRMWHNPGRIVTCQYNIFQANSLEVLVGFCISGTSAGDCFCGCDKPSTSFGSLTQPFYASPGPELHITSWSLQEGHSEGHFGCYLQELAGVRVVLLQRGVPETNCSVFTRVWGAPGASGELLGLFAGPDASGWGSLRRGRANFLCIVPTLI